MRESAARLCQGLLCAALALIAGGSPARALDLDVAIGFGSGPRMPARYRQNSWTPVMVFVRGQGGGGVAQLQVTVRGVSRPMVFTRRVALPAGPTDEAHSFVIPPTGERASGFANAGIASGVEVAAQLLQKGRRLAERKTPLPMPVPSEAFNVLALTRDGSGLNFLTRKRLGLFHRGIDPGGARGASGAMLGNSSPDDFSVTEVYYPDPRALPATAQGYDMIDAVAWADLPPDALTEAQQEALRDYIRQGGLLLVSGGGDLARLRSKFLAELLPVTPADAVLASNFPVLTRRYKHPFDAETTLTTGTLAPEGRTLFAGSATGSLPLVSARPYGNGAVVFTGFDFLAPELRAWKGSPALWRDLLKCGGRAVSPRALLASHAETPYYAYYGRNAALSDALAGQQAANTPEFPLVAGFLGAYIALLVPGSYLLLKKLDRREWAWVTMPIIVLGFTVGSYLIAQNIKGSWLVANRAVVLEAQANSDEAAGYGLMTLYSPRRAAYEIAFGEAGSERFRLAVPNEVFTSEQAPGESITVRQDRETVLSDVNVRLWDKRSFAVPFSAALGGPVEVRARWTGAHRAAVTVTNRTRFALRDCALVNGGQPVKLGDLAPGASATQAISWEEGRTDGRLPLPALSETAAGAGGKQAETSRKIAAGMQQTLGMDPQRRAYYGYEGQETYGLATNAFTGWIAEPQMPARINGQQAGGAEACLLLVHLPPPPDAPPATRADANPFLAPPLRQVPDESPRSGQRQGIFR